ncbi:WD40 repeat domain-containing protein [Leptothoe sp. LEGE 181152]|nr:WD40 repeat domain-containing protein [Leptothoe sp. LEGE 181152]
MNKQELQNLLKEREGLKLDFKREPHKINHPNQDVKRWQRDEFIKDILALTNGGIGTANQTAYLIYGIAESDGQNIFYDFSFEYFATENEIKNLSALEQTLLEIVNNACSPPIQSLVCDLHKIEESKIFVISIPPTFTLHAITRKLTTGRNKTYSKTVTFIRHNQAIDICDPTERENILDDKKKARMLFEGESNTYKNLTDLDFIRNEIIDSSLSSLFEDYSAALKPAASIPRDKKKNLCLIQAALRKSEKVLSKDLNQLASQLLGRLFVFKEAEIRKISSKFIESQKQNQKAWLKPLSSSLEPPVTSLIYNIRERKRTLLDIKIDVHSSKLLSSYSDGSLIIWDLGNGKKSHTYQEHKTLINDFTITFDSEKIISASDDGSLKIRNLLNDTSIPLINIPLINAHKEAINAVAVTPDNQMIISASDDKRIKFWCLQSGKCLHSEEYDDAVTSIAITHNNEYVFLAVDNSVKIIQVKSKDIVCSIPAHSERINLLLLSSNSENLISISDDETIKVWNLSEIFHNPKMEPKPKVRSGYLVKDILINPIENSIIFTTIDDDNLVRIWEWESEKLDFIEGHSRPINALTITPDGKQIITASSEPISDKSVDEIICVWNLENKKRSVTLKDHEQTINAVTIAPNGQRFVSASPGERIKIWDLLSKQDLLPEEKHTDTVVSIKVTSNGEYAISTSYDKTLRVWQIKNGSCFRVCKFDNQISHFMIKNQQIVFISDSKIENYEAENSLQTEIGKDIFYIQDYLSKATQPISLGNHSSFINSIIYTPDGQHLISASSGKDDNLKIWDISSRELYKTLLGHNDDVKFLAINLERDWLISGSENRTIVWDLKSFECLYTFEAKEATAAKQPDRFNNIAFESPDNYRITVNDADINFWDLSTGELLHTFKDGDSYITAVAVTHDLKYLISTNKNNDLEAWKLRKDFPEYSTPAHTQPITSIVISPCNRYVVSTSEDYSLKVWNLEELLNQPEDEDSENEKGSYGEIATFTGDSEITTCAISPDMIIVAGEKSGRVHFLELCGF